ncbi:MAG: ABC transporter ATP-binding protein [Tepidisphaeraceae bacterium]
MASEPQPKPSQLKHLRSLWTFTAGYRGRYVLAIAALAASTLLGYAAPLVIGSVIDGVLNNSRQPGSQARFVLGLLGGAEYVRAHLWIAAIALTCAVAFSGAFGFLRGYFTSTAAESIIRRLRNQLYDQLQHVPPAWHDTQATGDLVQRCSSDVDTTRNFYQSQFVEIVDGLVRLCTVIPIMIWIDWRMAIAATCVLPVIVGFSAFFFKRVQGSFKRADEAEGAMSATMQENLTGIRVVRAFARRDFEVERFAVKNETHRSLSFKLFLVMAAYWASSDLMCFTQLAAVVGYGVYRVSQGGLSVGEYVAFWGFATMYIWPVRHMGKILTELGKTLVALGRINEVLDAPREADPATPAALPARVQGRIEFAGVSFAHKDKAVLDGVSFTVEPGQTIALLGPSGSGKSTIINLLLRFYDPSAGTITLDGVALSNLRRKDVRRQIGIVMQEPFLYGKTVRDNIRLGRFDAPEDEIIESASIASIHESIQKFEKQYETVVGERGVTLSGGQRQRVAIARALLKDAPILVLDDALSAVDTHTEADIINALKTRSGRQTTILIAHRLSTLMHADRILVIEGGRITQQGTHAELVQQPGLYRGLWSIQSELEEDLQLELGRPSSGAAFLPASVARSNDQTNS